MAASSNSHSSSTAASEWRLTSSLRWWDDEKELHKEEDVAVCSTASEAIDGEPATAREAGAEICGEAVVEGEEEGLLADRRLNMDEKAAVREDLCLEAS